MICWQFKNISLVVKILEASADFVNDVWTSVFVPPVMFVVQLVLFVWWVVTLVFLYTSGELD